MYVKINHFQKLIIIMLLKVRSIVDYMIIAISLISFIVKALFMIPEKLLKLLI